MGLECLNHDNHMPDIDYWNSLHDKYKTTNSEELFNAALEDMRERRGLYRFLDYKFKLKNN